MSTSRSATRRWRRRPSGKGLGQLEFDVVKQAEQLAKLRHKVFGESSSGTSARTRPAPSRRDSRDPRRATGQRHSCGCRPARSITGSRTTSARARLARPLEEMGEVTEDASEVTVEQRRFVVVKRKQYNIRVAATAP